MDMFLNANMIFYLFILITTLFAIIYIYFHFCYQYWEKRKFPFLHPSFPLGNCPRLIKKVRVFGLETIDYYENARKMGYKFAGLYTITRPVLVVVDPEYMKDILVKDFHHFIDRGFFYDEKNDPITAHLFALNEKKWKNMRIKLTPTFSSGKIKQMFPVVVDSSENMIKAMEKSALKKEDLNMKDFCARFTTDVIGSCAFGIECNSFKNPDAEFRKMGIAIFEVPNVFHLFKIILSSIAPDLIRNLGIKTTRSDVNKFFFDTVTETIKHRLDNGVYRPDFLHLLMELMETSKNTFNPFTMKQLISQVFLFFVAGFETSSTAMNFALYELCRNQGCQEKLRMEIRKTLGEYNAKITYENLSTMKYLQQVIDETLRLYPSVPVLTRVCTKDYRLKNTDLIVEKGTPIVMPILSLQRDPEYYENPEKFDPERFSSENNNSRNLFYHFPFGEGPRNCIGLRFGLLQMKIGLVQILKKFRLNISPKTKMPLRLDPQYFLLKTTEPLYVNVEMIND